MNAFPSIPKGPMHSTDDNTVVSMKTLRKVLVCLQPASIDPNSNVVWYAAQEEFKRVMWSTLSKEFGFPQTHTINIALKELPK